jgi:hypothetical protein
MGVVSSGCLYAKSIESDFKNRGLVLEQLMIRNITLPDRVK